MLSVDILGHLIATQIAARAARRHTSLILNPTIVRVKPIARIKRLAAHQIDSRANDKLNITFHNTHSSTAIMSAADKLATQEGAPPSVAALSIADAANPAGRATEQVIDP